MNERIRELLKQAGFIGEGMNPIVGTCQETALKNFAELIIRECAEVGAEGQGSIDSGYIQRAVLQHFGVEE